MVALDLVIQPEQRVMWARDVHGNSLALVDFEAPADQLAIIYDVTIERREPFPARRAMAS